MQVVALTHFPFLGKQRKPGSTITDADWNKASEAARAALINGGHVRVGNGDQAHTAVRTIHGQGEAETDNTLLLQGISAKLDRALGGLAKAGLLEDAPEISAAASPAKKVKAKKKRAKAKKPARIAPGPALEQD